MDQTIFGIIHGKTIELESPLSVADGSKVQVTIRTNPEPNKLELLLSLGGALADDWSELDDQILAQIAKDRESATERSCD